MSPGDTLFVPSGGAVSWRAKGEGKEEDEAVALRFCYVDASNFNSVKSQLPLYAAVEVRCTYVRRHALSVVQSTVNGQVNKHCFPS